MSEGRNTGEVARLDQFGGSTFNSGAFLKTLLKVWGCWSLGHRLPRKQCHQNHPKISGRHQVLAANVRWVLSKWMMTRRWSSRHSLISQADRDTSKGQNCYVWTSIYVKMSCVSVSMVKTDDITSYGMFSCKKKMAWNELSVRLEILQDADIDVASNCVDLLANLMTHGRQGELRAARLLRPACTKWCHFMSCSAQWVGSIQGSIWILKHLDQCVQHGWRRQFVTWHHFTIRFASARKSISNAKVRNCNCCTDRKL